MTATDTLLSKWADISALSAAGGLAGWDQETMLPSKGHETRGQVMSVLAGLHHDKLTDPSLADVVEQAGAAAESDGDEVLAAHVREARQDIRRAVAVPGGLARRLAETTSRALGVWQQARADADFSQFAPVLGEVVALTRERAEALVDSGIATTPYDALLDEYEPGATEVELVDLFGDLRSRLAPLVKAAADSGVVIDESPARGSFAEDDQRALGVAVATMIGFDFQAGRLDTAAHPFTTGIGPGDVRITWRSEADDFRPGLLGIMHECGHGMYEQGLPAEWAATPLGSAVSLGVHESQSRLWENQVGRSRAFWEGALPLLHEHLPGTDGVTVDALYAALHTVTPSFIRVEADEATYNLHIIARFEIERRLIGGDVAVDELPELWDATSEELLGIRPDSAANGVLQDLHWAMGAIGYFPTYALGNLIAAQLFEAANEAIDDLPGRIASRDFSPLLTWLRENVHRHGRALTADEMIRRATGGPLSSEPFLAYLTSTVNEVYGV